ncbi:unnamed protein product [Rangifer tarandus platyrhynchus]|uniref:Uncharacterized protein n=2 Tax=Rangifer tarandus platyrhynchus TaxID=3082113 RepID=A0AC59Y9J0_RANTA|nr:unnamed protein product [Rangifer tarandus platyrhynchus]
MFPSLGRGTGSHQVVALLSPGPSILRLLHLCGSSCPGGPCGSVSTASPRCVRGVARVGLSIHGQPALGPLQLLCVLRCEGLLRSLSSGWGHAPRSGVAGLMV